MNYFFIFMIIATIYLLCRKEKEIIKKEYVYNENGQIILTISSRIDNKRNRRYSDRRSDSYKSIEKALKIFAKK